MSRYSWWESWQGIFLTRGKKHHFAYRAWLLTYRYTCTASGPILWRQKPISAQLVRGPRWRQIFAHVLRCLPPKHVMPKIDIPILLPFEEVSHWHYDNFSSRSFMLVIGSQVLLSTSCPASSAHSERTGRPLLAIECTQRRFSSRSRDPNPTQSSIMHRWDYWNNTWRIIAKEGKLFSFFRPLQTN